MRTPQSSEMSASGASHEPLSPTAETASLPMAEIRSVSTPRPWWDWGLGVWLVALGALLLSIGLIVSSRNGRGLEINVGFDEGHGVKVGDAVRHRGIDIGEVKAVSLSPDFDRVVVRLQLFPDAAGMAREGTRFWIQRPRLGLRNLSGLDTVLGAKYIAVWPGDSSAPPMRSFVGLEAPLLMMGDEEVEVRVRFEDGHGIAIGSPVRHRGVEIGEVISFEFEPGLRGLHVGLRLVRGAPQFARAGSQFWIERPNVSLTTVRGLDTILGGPYVAVQPGTESAEACFEFDGLDVPPAALPQLGAGIEFLLASKERKSLERGAPVTYRGLEIGQVLSVGLSTDARKVEARVYVRAPYHDLLRDNTQFWSYGGMDFSLGITGLSLNLDNLATVAAGGIALATPEPPGKSIHTGHRYQLLEEPPSGWREWAPRIGISSPLLHASVPLPSLQRASLTWKTRRLGLTRTHRRSGWILPLDDQSWLIPRPLVDPEAEAVAGSTSLEVAGVQLSLDDLLQEDALVIHNQIPDSLREQISLWPESAVRRGANLRELDEIVLFTGLQEPQLVVVPNRLSFDEQHGHWSVDAAVPLDEHWLGAAAISRRDATLVGIVTFHAGSARIIPIP